MYVFPDAPACIKEVLVGAGLNATLWLEAQDVDGRETVHVQDAGGTEQSIFRNDRIMIDVYATGRTAAKDLAEAVKVLLVDKPHDTSGGVIDNISVEVVPTMEQYPSDVVSKFNAIYRAESRPI